ncbi:hypothetical protein Gotur_002234, partial [Gossypium turneri]
MQLLGELFGMRMEIGSLVRARLFMPNFGAFWRVSRLSNEESILSQEKQWSLRYIPREQNQVADCLVKQAL